MSDHYTNITRARICGREVLRRNDGYVDGYSLSHAIDLENFDEGMNAPHVIEYAKVVSKNLGVKYEDIIVHVTEGEDYDLFMWLHPFVAFFYVSTQCYTNDRAMTASVELYKWITNISINESKIYTVNWKDESRLTESIFAVVLRHSNKGVTRSDLSRLCQHSGITAEARNKALDDLVACGAVGAQKDEKVHGRPAMIYKALRKMI